MSGQETSFPLQVLAEQCGVAARTAFGVWPAMAPAAWRVCMRQTFTVAASAAVAAELAVAGAEARRSVRLFMVDNDTSLARQPLCIVALFQTHRLSQQDNGLCSFHAACLQKQALYWRPHMPEFR